MMGIDVGAVKQCFVDLAKADTSGDYDKALKIANKILRNFPREVLAFKCKLIALIRLNKLEDALTLIKKTPPRNMGECQFEKAYIQYRLNNDEEALETLNKIEEGNSIACLELKAQLLYRLQKFDEAKLILRKLLKDYSDDLDDDRRANFVAVLAQLHSKGIEQPRETKFETSEQYYNASCHAIEAEEFSSALSMLKTAEALCTQALTEEGLSEEEIEDELTFIRVQQAFVYQKLCQVDKAVRIYSRIQEIKPSDAVALATVLNNVPSVRHEFNLLDARKKLKSALQVDNSKLTERQRRTLSLNQALMYLHSNQREPCRRTLEKVRTLYGISKELNLIEACLHVRSKDTEKALSILGSAQQTDEIMLATVQILLNEGKYGEAAKTLSALPAKLSGKPGILQLRIALLLAIGQNKEALSVLEMAIQSTSDTNGLCLLLEESASLYTKLGDHESALDYLKKLADLNPSLHNRARLIKAYSKVDQAMAEKLLQSLPLEQNGNINVITLENSEWILYGDRYKQKKDTKPEFVDTEIVTGKIRKRKRKRKIILPKNFDPKIPPDPERWLPRQERTAYKKKLHKKHRDREIGRGTQGTTSSQVDAPAKVEESPKATPVMNAREGPRQQRPAAQQVKKKKKKPGNKW